MRAPIACTLALALCSLSLSAAAKPVAEPISWNHGGTDFDGVLVYDDGSKEKRPGLVMVPNWYGVNDEAIAKAQQIAGDDYVILVVDMYGRGVRPANADEAGKASGAVYADPDALRGRIKRALGVLEATAARAPLDVERLGGIGFCFGGAIVLDLARSGANVDGVVAFHSNLATQRPAEAGAVKAAVLALNGADDYFVSAEQRAGFEKEMRDAGADWQSVDFGGALHCFTEASEDGIKLPGCKYDERAAKRSFVMMESFFDERFGD
ncbi:dienelactone hydrolase family protein [Arenimonas terrae]|uniref:Dienelactone hydrolase family protein n=1 Tax=Arenimonas terrae TaxID=2546226 RepID=A0A5C4RQW0_9GAMM|nr:dienelactone hydrolase family protein [Arenimonas terrae]TNJ33663.1 dienelactone hydrolase family protein [Arenimonas terrae]